MAQTCRSCGSDNSGLVCRFCGAVLTRVAAGEELNALLEYHDAVRDAPGDDKRAEMLRHGYVPDHQDALIEAGLRCLPLIDPAMLLLPVPSAAVDRLRLIITKLKLCPPDDRVRRAIAEFEARLSQAREENRRGDRESIRAAIGCFAVLLVIAAAAIFGVMWWLG